MSLDENVGGLLTLTAGSDLSTKQYYAVKIHTDGLLALTAAGECVAGILYTKPSASGTVASVHPLNGRKTKAIAGGTIAKGDLLASDANGKLVTATKAATNTSDAGAAADALIGSFVCGVALEAAVSGDIFQFLALPLGAVPTTAA
jgi:hypothetical protein